MATIIQPPIFSPSPTFLFSFTAQTLPFSSSKTLLLLSLPNPNPNPNPHRRCHCRHIIRFSPTPQPTHVSSHPSLAGTKSAKPLSRSKPLDLDSSRDDIAYYAKLLQLSVQYGDAELARAVHAFFAKLNENSCLGHALITAYLKLGLLRDASSVFASLSSPNVASYSALISGFAKSRRELEAVELFLKMRRSGIEPNEYSFVAVLTACNRIVRLGLGLQVHALAIKMGRAGSVFVSNALMGLYTKCGCSDFALKVFVEMRERDVASWNTVLSSLVKELKYEKAFEFFCYMQRMDGFRVDHFTLSTLLTACTGSFAAIEGRELHAFAIKNGLGGNLSVNNALLGFYIKCGTLEDAETLYKRMPSKDIITSTEMVRAYMEFGLVDLAVEIFDSMPERNGICYNALLAGYCRNGQGWRALTLFIRMVEDGIELSESTLTNVVSACGLLMNGKIGEQIHAFVLKVGFGSNCCIESALLDMCTRCGRMADAEKMFHRSPFDLEKSINWTSMIGGYARSGQLEEAIDLFRQYQSDGTVVLDDVASNSVLSVCGSLGFHEMGKQIHCHALKSGFFADIMVGNSMISMYSKCWNMDDAIKVFDVMPVHNIVSWNSLLAAYILHRKGDEALAIWAKIEKESLEPDAITLILVILAYRHTSTNLVDECQKLFLSMKTVYGIEPTSDHYASLIGVLGFWGLLEEAEEMIATMPFEPTSSVWRALLDSCRIHLNITVGQRVAKHIIAMERQDPSTYILAANVYSASGRWLSSQMVREEMRGKGIRKHPARSWIILQNTVQSFYSRDKSHSRTEDIYGELERLIPECLKAGYVPDTSFVLHDLEEHNKGEFLFHHSAKLAASYGLLTTEPGKPVLVVKNIQLCGDCHSFLKYVSVVTKREIVLRDASGFHCFSNGKCSCRDHW